MFVCYEDLGSSVFAVFGSCRLGFLLNKTALKKKKVCPGSRRNHVSHGHLQFENLRILANDLFWLSNRFLLVHVAGFLQRKFSAKDQSTDFHYCCFPDCPQNDDWHMYFNSFSWRVQLTASVFYYITGQCKSSFVLYV